MKNVIFAGVIVLPMAAATISCDETVDRGVTVEDVVASPTIYSNTEVTLRGKLGKVFSPNVFEVVDAGRLTNARLLVITTSNIGYLTPEEGDDYQLTVTGKVQSFSRADIERETGLTLGPELEVEHQNRPVLIATSTVVAVD